MDPSLDTEFANGLKQTCPRHGGDPNIVQPFDPMTPFTFDNLYYQSLSKHQGLLTSDQVLFDDNRTRALVQLYEKNQTSFFDAFVSGMRKLQDIEVKTGQDGELRNDCSKFNS
ncbi:hypothetical protein O6H91_08G073400 [Diphasiastrum complanatum]|uniref:Uncharacterized protein n=1 Tax=Diphasiastrum complanatum TaxID=34168 RepID=A0ACC2CYU3_DIPCM|nr:hypothetical protein O6H91_08G073400 [Diphasiastrum complanatum]